MASVRVQRGPVRAQFTKAHKKLCDELAKEAYDPKLVDTLFRRLQTRREKLSELDVIVEEELRGDEASTEATFETEYEGVNQYLDQFTDIEAAVTAKLRPKEDVETASTSGGVRTKYRLPQLELKKFNGDAREWLGFWSQYSSIHNDEEMTPQDKFQYLLQATVEKSPARAVVESFPPSAENYPRAVDYLKTRFGNEDMLREVYVRDLLQLVIKRSEKKSVGKLYDQLETQLRALESLGVDRDNNVALLFPMVESALPEETLRAWERSSSRNAAGENRLTRLLDFLKLEVESETRIKMAKNGFASEDKGMKMGMKKREDKVSTASELYNGQGNSSKANQLCVFCDKGHKTTDCNVAKTMSLADKQDAVKRSKACFLCLRRGHISRNCKANVSCQVCGGKHQSVMCRDLAHHKVAASNNATTEVSGVGAGSSSSNLSNHSATGVLLQTLEVGVKVGDKSCFVRAVVDTGSQHSYITKNVIEHLGLKPTRQLKMAHCLFGGQQTREVTHRGYTVEVSPRDWSYALTAEFLDQAKICGAISCVPEGPWLQELNGADIVLSDVGTQGREINMLLGADLAGHLFTGRMYPTRNGPVAMETCLGWTLMGKCHRVNNSTDSSMLATTLHVSNVDLQDLWRLDVLGITDATETKSRSDMTQEAVKHFRKTVKINQEGRYEVSLPWIEGHPPVSNNRVLAEKQLKSAYKKIKAKGCLENIQRIFDEWEALGVIEKVNVSEDDNSGSFLPHHYVFKPASKTTPIRPVFNASATSEGNPSLNDCLEKGPNMIELIPDVLNRFRMKKFGVVSDIKKAFLQISVKEEDRNFLKFLWWENGHLQVYRHCRVVFGINSSPFLLAATIAFHLEKADKSVEDVVEILRKCMYVDNNITSLDSEEEVKRFIRVATNLMATASMELRGWVWTMADSLTMECEEKDEVVPVLGLLWNRRTDNLKLDLRGVVSEEVRACLPQSEASEVSSLVSRECGLDVGPGEAVRVTKRLILSASQSVFDTQGFASPVTVVPKILLQELWLRKLGWDETVGAEEAKRFNSLKKSLFNLDKMEVPRWVLQEDKGNVTLHVFSDASKAAYATCVFVRNECSSGVRVQLMMSKSRVSPTKKMTIPRLELLGWVIGARLGDKCKEIIEVPDMKTYYWTDSSNALYWIQKKECWATFVWNRVEEIRKLSSPEEWRHVPGELNPADLPSRGCSAKTLIESQWWEGPAWLKLSEDQWPKSQVNVDIELVMAEKKKSVVSQLATKRESPWFLSKMSSYRKTVRLVAWILRWRNSVKLGTLKKTGRLSPEEEEAAELCLIRVIQSGFTSEDSSLRTLNAVQDSSGIWRVNTKILMRNDDKDFKRPILLPTYDPVTKLLIKSEHKMKFHCGIQVLMSSLRERYWIPKARKVIREIIRSCGTCRRFTALRGEACPAPLPLDRVRDAAVFEVTGIDLGGPLFLKNGDKVWFVLFTCAVYRAIHLELVTSVSTEAFLQSLRRFIARRGRPTTVYTDNGTNFEGSSNALKKLDWVRITEETGAQKIRWIFNPPSAPWWGGFWERLVGVVKVQLRRILGKACLEYEELLTVMCDVEEIVNSRPLTYLSEDPDDLQPVTPSMFLTDLKAHGVPDLHKVDSQSLKKRLQYRQSLRDDLRKRFRDEYLAYLVQRRKNKSSGREIRKDDVVLVEFDNKKRIDWPLGRVMELFPGRDGVARVARVKTAKGELTRPVQRLFQLEVVNEDDPTVEALKVEDQVGGVKKTSQVTRSGRVSKIPQRFME